MNELLPFVITGLTAGALYGLAGLGLVLTYRCSGVLNLAHGAVAAAAAALFYTLHVEWGLAWPPAALIAVVIFAVIGGLFLEGVTRSLGDAPVAVTVVATVGLLLAINGGLNLIYGAAVRRFPEFLPTSGFTVSGVTITWGQVIAIGLATGAALGLYLFLQRSRLGVAMRAVVDDRTLVSLTGMPPTRIRRAAWAIGSAFAAASGILLAPVLGLDATLLTFLVVQAFGACAIGRFTSLPLTYVGGLAVGVAASIATRYLVNPPWSGIPSTVPYLALIVVLLAVPTRRLPEFHRVARSIQSRPSGTARSRAYLAVALLVGLVAVPTFVGSNLPVWISALIYSIIFASLALLVWMSGQLSLCHMAFAALGATTFAKLQSAGVPWGVALLGAGLLTMPAGALVAVPAIRLSGVYLALVTLGFGIFMQNVVFQTDLMFGSSLFARATRPSWGPIDGTNDKWFYFVTLAIAVAALGLVVAVARSRMGLFLRALAESPTMLATHGLAVNLTRLLVFSLSAFLAAVAGALLVCQSGSISGIGFGPTQSMILVAVLAMCGTRPIRSPVVAAALFAVVPAYVTAFGVDQQEFFFGVAAVVAAIVLAQRKRIEQWVATAAANSEARSERRDRLELLPVDVFSPALPAGEPW